MFKISYFIKKIRNVYIKNFCASVIRVLLIPLRASIAWKYLGSPIKKAIKWLFESRETSNFSYNLSSINYAYLAHTISVVTGQSVEKIRGYIKEIKENKNIKEHIKENIQNNPDNFKLDLQVAFGRRVGWYAVVRAIKPKIVVETGVDQGIGSCIIAEALRKNSQQGKKGRYFGTDIYLEAGALFTGDYKKYGEILYGDSIKSLKKFNKKIDLFINDSDHHSGYEAREYEVVKKLLNKDSVVLGDNSHVSEALSKFAEKTNRNFVFFKEEPYNHWYPGAGIGFSYAKK